ncbi:MAG: hypothetical protein BAA01_02630 [Bacillus thermozeamaize]|uniref:DNA ligase (ATP) n=1 Tax=Bacillus thermozeamaize TaxID=230954 RepID=A0A1Y3PU55_9BACI|nr:MAG: hypothetical protein BAA01_02630 [Bacillus thermozeamaize]
MTLPFLPMEPILMEEPFQDARFRYQVKWDGIRAIVIRDNHILRVFLRKGGEITSHFPELQGLRLKQAGDFILDGELIVPDEDNRPSFSRVVRRIRIRKPDRIEKAQKTDPAVLMAFDLMKLGERDVCHLPWSRRQELLEQALLPSEHVQIVESFADGLGLYQATKQWGLEGIVAKRIDSQYLPGKRHRAWFKIKHWQEIEAVIGGLELKEQGMIRSLYLGAANGKGGLRFIGQASSGLRQADWHLIQKEIPRLQQKDSPFAALPHTPRDVIWLKPELRATIRFQSWTESHLLRSPVILRIKK